MAIIHISYTLTLFSNIQETNLECERNRMLVLRTEWLSFFDLIAALVNVDTPTHDVAVTQVHGKYPDSWKVGGLSACANGVYQALSFSLPQEPGYKASHYLCTSTVFAIVFLVI